MSRLGARREKKEEGLHDVTILSHVCLHPWRHQWEGSKMMQLWDQVADDVGVRSRRERERGRGRRGRSRWWWWWGGAWRSLLRREVWIWNWTQKHDADSLSTPRWPEPSSDTRPLCCRWCVLPATDASLNSSFYLLHQGSPNKASFYWGYFCIYFFYYYIQRLRNQSTLLSNLYLSFPARSFC